MTEAIGGAGQSAFVVQSGSAKVSGGARRVDAGYKHGIAQNAILSSNAIQGSEEAVGQSSVQKAGKASRRTNDDAGQSDDLDNSFEATIDSIDKSSLPTADGDATQAAKWSAQFMLGQMSMARALTSDGANAGVGSAASGKALVANAPATLLNQESLTDTSTKSQIASVPASLLNQESVTALSANKHRLQSGEAPQDASADQSADATNASSVVVQSRETHWGFGISTATASSDGARLPEGNSIASNPLASLDSPRVAKDDSRLTTASTDATNTAPEQSSPLDVVRDAPQGHPFSEPHDRGSSRGNQTSSGANDNASSEISAPKSADLGAVDGTATVSASPTATQQVQEGVLDALASDAGGTQQASASQPLQNTPTISGQVLRTIELTLSPADLGSVHLRLSLKSNTLSIEAETSKASTAKLLNDDRGVLEQNLRDAGFDLSTLKITDAGTNNSTSTNSSLAGGTQFQDGGQTRAGFAQRQDGDMQRRDGSTPDQSDQRSKGGNPQASPASDTANARLSNAIYI